jgi:integrase
MTLTVRKVFESYINEWCIPERCDVPRTRIVQRHIEAFTTPDVKAKKWDRARSREYRDLRYSQGVGAGTVRKELAIWRAALSHAVKENRLKAVPYIEMPPSPPARERYWEVHEMQRLMLSLRDAVRRPSADHIDWRTWYFYWIAFETWARAGAIEQLTVGRVDLERGMIDFRVPGMKISKKRRGEVAISEALRPILDEAIHRNGPPWKDDLLIGPGVTRRRKDGTRRPYSSTSQGCKRALKRAGMKEKWVLRHVCRKTGATLSVMAGSSIEEAAQVLHDTPHTTAKHYAKYKPEFARPAVNRKPPPLLPVQSNSEAP